MSCKKYINLLSDYIDGVLSDSERKTLESHLKQCSDCRKNLELLQNYKKISSSFKHRIAPDSIRDNVWRHISVDNAERSGHKEGKVMPLKLTWLVLAASIIGFVIVMPSLTKSNEITVDFDYQPISTGKGPDEKGEKTGESDTRVLAIFNLAEKLECKVKDVYRNPAGMTDGMTVKVPKTKYDSFRKGFNSFEISETLPEMLFRSKRGSMIIQVYFSGRKFFTGDFNNDGRIDVGAYFNQGRNSGKFYVSYNDGKDGFLMPVRFQIYDTLYYVTRSDEILSGDFNNDGLYDLLIRFSGETNIDNWIIYLNNGKECFEKGIKCKFRGSQYAKSGLEYSFTGDFNGDGFTDIGIHHITVEDKGKFQVFYNNKNLSFNAPVEFTTGHSGLPASEKYTPVILDINNDNYSDIIIYWQEGEHNAMWYVSENTGSGTGAIEYKAGFNEKGTLAFWGSYLPFSGDMDGDGYDDLLVKIGTSDEVSNWYLMKNDRDGSFTSAGHFIDFNGEIDFFVR
jgi:hypothetical protein